MKIFKKILKKISLIALCLIMAITLTSCNDNEMLVSIVTMIDKGFNADTNNNGQRLTTIIEQKFKYYNEVLDKLIEMGLVSSPDAYKAAMETNKNYLIDYLVKKKQVDIDLVGSIPWVIDPQYICRLYNDLQYIKVVLSVEGDNNLGRKNTGGGDWKGIERGYDWAIYDASDLPDLDNEFSLEDEDDPDRDISNNNLETDYWNELKSILDSYPVSGDSIRYTISVIDSICQGLTLNDVINTGTKQDSLGINNDRLKGVKDFFKNIINAFTGGNNSEDSSPNVFKFFNEGDRQVNIYTKKLHQADSSKMNEDYNFLWRVKGIGYYNNIDDFYTNAKAQFLNSFPEMTDILNLKLEENVGGIKGGASSSFEYTITADGSDNEEDLQAWQERCENTYKMAKQIAYLLQMSACGGGRHSVCYAEIAKDNYTTEATLSKEVITYTCSINIRMVTSKMMFLNSKDLSNYLLSSYTSYTGMNANSNADLAPHIKYRMCAEVITSSERTLVDYPYVFYANEGDIENLVSLDKVVQTNDNSVIKGRNVCSPENNETDRYNTDINTKIRVFSYKTDNNNEDLNNIRTYLKTYASLDKDTQKAIGDKIVNWTQPVTGKEGFVETENIMKTTDYERHKDNLKYFTVLKSVACGNTGNTAVDYNPSNEIGNDLIVTIANIPAFAIRLLEFDSQADTIQNEAIEREKEKGYISIRTSNENFLLDPKSKIKAITSIDSTTNTVNLDDTNLIFNFMTGHIYKADLDNLVKPIDQINSSDRETVAKRFIDKNRFSYYFGPSIPGYLTLMAYEPLYWEDNDEIVKGNWYPLGRTLYLDKTNFTMSFSNGDDENKIYIKNALDPIGYLGTASANTYSKNSTPIYLKDICGTGDDNNTNFMGEEIERVSMFDDDFVEVLEDYTRDNTTSVSLKTITAPLGEFKEVSSGKTYIIPEDPNDDNNYTQINQNLYVPNEGYYYCIDQISSGEGNKYYLYYFEDNLISYDVPEKDKSKYEVDEDTGRIIAKKSGDYVQKPYKDEATSQIRTLTTFTQIETYAKNELNPKFANNQTLPSSDPNLYSQTNYNLSIDLPIIGSKAIRRDCSAYISTITLKMDEIENFKTDTTSEGHFLTSGGDLAGTYWMINDDLSKTNFKLTKNYCSSTIQNSIKVGDILVHGRTDNNTSGGESGHVIYISGVDNNGIYIYHWTSAAAKGGPYFIPYGNVDSANTNGSWKGYCTKQGNAIKICIPSPMANSNSNAGMAKVYEGLIRKK